MTAVGPDPATTAVVVLGASQWPEASQFEPAAQFKNSAREFVRFMSASNGGRLDGEHILDLFDSNEEQPVIVRRIAEFLLRLGQKLNSSGQSLTDVITFYVGHGGFDTGSNSSYFLAIRRTNPIDYLGSSLSAASLRRALREHAGGARHYLILDCCFAAAAVGTYIHMSAAVQTVVAQVQDSFPPSGTALLCAAGARTPAKANREATYTMFSEGLLEVLQRGLPDAPAWLTISQLGEAIRNFLRNRYLDEAVRPEVHSPEQSKGSVANVPIFKNASAEIEKEVSHNSSLSDVDEVELEVNSNTGQQFIREFQDSDQPATIRGHTFSEPVWAEFPEPIKTLLTEFQTLDRDKTNLLGGLAAISFLGNALTFVCIYFRLFSAEIRVLLASIGGLSAFICLIWTLVCVYFLLKGKKFIDRRVLRLQTQGSEAWESRYGLEPLRQPRRIIRVWSGQYLEKRMYEYIQIGLWGVVPCAALWLFIYFTQ